MANSSFYMDNFLYFLYGQVDFLDGQLFTFYIGQCKTQTADFRLRR